MEDLHNVVVVAATNRPDILDSALLRPGRFDRQVVVIPPDAKSREEIFRIHTKSMPLAKDIDPKSLAKATEGFSGADIEALVREAGLFSLRESFTAKIVSKKHFDKAMKEVSPSITKDMRDFYTKLSESMKNPIVKEKEKELSYVG